jgi:hypothetical protein
MRNLGIVALGAAALAAVMAPRVLNAQELTKDLKAKELLAICDDAGKRLVCSAYIAGIVNAVEYFNTKFRVISGFPASGDSFCLFEKKPSQAEIESIALSFIRRFTIDKIADMPASIAGDFSLIVAFPCKKGDLF